ncbi:uncharacterized protein LOC128652165 [Bombina bombina]|uniref:uncharacterized protein LOC128652165 n=1 Tax=Bombina bombina TaxID=8345 RepID=UPI00235A895B|nr:uncharacterized protein LOC128652165 [Bombina bombina]
MCITPDGASISRTTAEVRRALGHLPTSSISSSDIEHAHNVLEKIASYVQQMRAIVEEESLGETQYPESQEHGISQGTFDTEALICAAPPALEDPATPPASVACVPAAHGHADPGHELPPITDDEAVCQMLNLATQYRVDHHELHGALRLSVDQQWQILERGIIVDRERLDLERERVRIEIGRKDLERERFAYKRMRDSERLELERDRFF